MVEHHQFAFIDHDLRKTLTFPLRVWAKAKSNKIETVTWLGLKQEKNGVLISRLNYLLTTRIH